jgi:hypothetical protein
MSGKRDSGRAVGAVLGHDWSGCFRANSIERTHNQEDYEGNDQEVDDRV